MGATIQDGRLMAEVYWPKSAAPRRLGSLGGVVHLASGNAW